MSQGDLRTYDPDQFFCSLAGIPISGYADGEWITVEPESPSFDDVVGTDGEVTRSKTNDERATVTIKLMQSSPVNDLLSALHTVDKNSPGGAGVGVFFLQDLQGTFQQSAEKAWISKGPDVALDRTATAREWVIRVAKLVSVHGGSVT
jgi:hypothetical protein